MNRKEFLKLVDKQQNGIATPEEDAKLQAIYERLQQREQLWDEQLLGDQERTERRILDSIIKPNFKMPVGKKNPYNWLKIAASIILVLFAGLFLFRSYYKKNTAAPIQYLQAAALPGEVLKITLADSSIVWLNAGSRLKYPTKFSGKSREVILEGEAFFDVKHHLTDPFIVRSGKMNTQVLGTSFNIKAFRDDPFATVTVTTGKVGVYNGTAAGIKSGATVFLTPGQAALFNTSSAQISRVTVKRDEITAWMQGKMVYRNTPLWVAARDLEHTYGIKIKLSQSIRTCPVYGTFKHKAAESILKTIALAINGKVKKEGDTYHISGTACH